MAGRRGLPASYITRHHGDMKAAWADYKQTHHKKGGSVATKHTRSPSVHEVTETKSPGLRASVQFQTEKRVDPEAIGQLLLGFVTEGISPTTGELSLYFPPGSVGEPGISNEESKEWFKGSDEREIGREMARALGFVLVKLNVTQAQWSAMYPRAMRAIAGQASSSVGGFAPPLDGPTEVTSPFGIPRPEGYHRGVDLRADLGSVVHAPWDAVVDFVGVDQGGGGNTVRLSIQQPDGGYVGVSPPYKIDDEGIVVSFLHLASSTVQKGDHVNAGDVIGYSGSTTGNGTIVAPHLHVMAELVSPAPLYSYAPNARVYVDPVTVWGGVEAITGRAPSIGPQPMPGATGVLLPGVVSGGPLTPQTIGSTSPISFTLGNGGVVQVIQGGGTAVNTQVPFKITLPLGDFLSGALAPSGGGTGDGSGGPPIHVQQGAQSAGATDLWSGIGNFAGSFVGTIGSAFGPVAKFVADVAPAVVGTVDVVGKTVNQLDQFLGFAAGPASTALVGAGAALTVATPFLAALGPGGEAAAGFTGIAGPVVGGTGTLVGLFGPSVAAAHGGVATAATGAFESIFGALAGMPAGNSNVVVPPLANESGNVSGVMPGPNQ